MDKETVYQAIARVESRRRDEKRSPTTVLIEELEKETGVDRQTLRPWLLELYREERIVCGHTLNSVYVMTMQP